MKNKDLTQKHWFSKWLVAVFVCFSFFVFAGGLSNVQPGQHRVLQTEIVLNSIQTNNKKLTSYYNRVRSFNKFYFKWFTTFETLILTNHNCSVQTKFKWLQQTYSSWITFYFSLLKTIPQNFKEDPKYFLLG